MDYEAVDTEWEERQVLLGPEGTAYDAREISLDALDALVATGLYPEATGEVVGIVGVTLTAYTTVRGVPMTKFFHGADRDAVERDFKNWIERRGDVRSAAFNVKED